MAVWGALLLSFAMPGAMPATALRVAIDIAGGTDPWTAVERWCVLLLSSAIAAATLALYHLRRREQRSARGP